MWNRAPYQKWPEKMPGVLTLPHGHKTNRHKSQSMELNAAGARTRRPHRTNLPHCAANGQGHVSSTTTEASEKIQR